MAKEIVILTRTFDLLDWLLPKAERFPKTYRFTVTQRSDGDLLTGQPCCIFERLLDVFQFEVGIGL